MQPERPMVEGPMPPESCTYVVKPGDSLSAIAVKHNTTIAALAKGNGIDNPSIIYVGQQVSIPGCEMAIAPIALEPMGSKMAMGQAPLMAPTQAEMMHRVGAGETLSEICAQYGVDPQAVAMMNGLANANFLYVGQQLRMP